LRTITLSQPLEGPVTSKVVYPTTSEILIQSVDDASPSDVVTIQGRIGSVGEWFTVTTLTGTQEKRIQAYPEMRAVWTTGTFSVHLREMIFSNAVIEWDSIANKPAEFPPEDHTHVMADITDLSLDWASITGKPSEFPPEDHSAAKITSGSLADARLSANVPLLNAANTFTNTNTIYNAAGSTLVTVRAGAAQSGSVINFVRASDGSTASSDAVSIYQSGSQMALGVPIFNLRNTMDFNANLIRLASNSTIGWNNNTNSTAASADVGLARNAAGQLKVTDGGAGSGRIFASHFTDTGSLFSLHSTSGLLLANTSPLAWSSTGAFSGGLDVGLARDAAGILKVTNGSSGFGALKIDQRLWFTISGANRAILKSPSNNNLEARNNDDTGYSDFQANGFYVATSKVQISSSQIDVSNTHTINWSSTSVYSGSKDVGLARDAAGILKVTDGSSGTGGLKVGNTETTTLRINTTISAPSPNAYSDVTTEILAYYGAGATPILGAPNGWISVNVNGTAARVPYYT
jgi:hypothetical protein